MLSTVYLAHLFIWICPSLLDILRSFEPVQQVISEGFIEIDGYAGYDL